MTEVVRKYPIFTYDGTNAAVVGPMAGMGTYEYTREENGQLIYTDSENFEDALASVGDYLISSQWYTPAQYAEQWHVLPEE